jgi:hypothetical protein
MANSFRKNGIQRCRIDTVIKVSMKRIWLEGEGSKDIEGTSIEEIPQLKLTDAGKQACASGQIKPMEGLGRRGGIEVLFNEYKKDLQTAQARQKKLKDKKQRTEKNESDITLLEGKISELEEKLKECTTWTFRVIDQGENVIYIRIIATELI